MAFVSKHPRPVRARGAAPAVLRLMLVLVLCPFTPAEEEVAAAAEAAGAEDMAAALRGEAGAGSGAPLCFAKAIETGMGDRLSTILSVAALARVLDRRVWVVWHTPPPGVNVHRMYAWETVAASVTLPAHVSVLVGANASKILEGCPLTSQIRMADPAYLEGVTLLGAEGIPQLAHAYFRVAGEERVKKEAFVTAFREVGEEFHVRALDWPLDFLERYVVLHVRGTDKRDLESGRSFCTDTVLHHLLTCGWDVVVVSDDAEM